MALEPPPFLLNRLAASVAVLGDGVSGKAAVSLLNAIGASAAVYDLNGREFTDAAAKRHLLVVFSPGFAPDHPWLKRARAAEALCLSEMDLGSLFWSGKRIAITGTNGKTTLTEFLAHALRAAGKAAAVAGNIGFPLSRLAAESDGGKPGAVAVCEVSSFQAETLAHFHADATLWTNFAEDHLERHAGLKAYFAAKWTLAERTTPGRLFAGSSVQRFADGFGHNLGPEARIDTEKEPLDPRLAGTAFARRPQYENFLLARAWWRSEGMDESILLRAAQAFRLGRHRLSKIGEVRGAGYWNDSKATNFHAVEAALGSFSSPVLLIAGGKSKGGDLAGFVRRIAPRIKGLFLIGETGDALADTCRTLGLAHRVFGSLEDAVKAASETAEAGDQVLLSPGFSSFDMFSNYEERGDHFEKAVQELEVIRV